jgi:hypothetical protein
MEQTTSPSDPVGGSAERLTLGAGVTLIGLPEDRAAALGLPPGFLSARGGQVRAGATFEKGVLVERPDEAEMKAAA